MFMYNYSKWVKYINEICKPITEPTFVTDNKIVLETDAYRLRQFAGGGDEHPVVILPPQSGHHSSICDYSQNNSLVRTFLKNGINSLYAIEWKSATSERASETLEDLMLHTHACVSSLDRKVNMVGLCQGGWQAAMYTALFADSVNSLVLAGAPIDAHADGGKIQEALQRFPSEFYKWLVQCGGGLYRGKYQLMAFKMMNPYDRFFGDYLELYLNIDDAKYLKRYHEFRNWYEFVIDIPGKWYLEIVDQLFRNNSLINSGMELFGKSVNLKNINCPLLLIAGSKDDITLPNQVFNTEKHVSTPKNRIRKFLADSGHIGLFMGSKALDTIWPEVIDNIRECSCTEEYELLKAS
jgi:poly(3-hydroxybutyrate) depolymerase